MGLMVKLTIVCLGMAMGTTIPITAFAIKVDKCNTLLTVICKTTLLGRCYFLNCHHGKGTKFGRHPILITYRHAQFNFF